MAILYQDSKTHENPSFEDRAPRLPPRRPSVSRNYFGGIGNRSQSFKTNRPARAYGLLDIIAKLKDQVQKADVVSGEDRTLAAVFAACN
jgi:hypothetical protein